MRRVEPRRRSVPSEDDIEPPDQQAIRSLVGKLSRLIQLGLSTWNEASDYVPLDSARYYEKVKSLKRKNVSLAQENAALQKELEEGPAAWTRTAQSSLERNLHTVLLQPLLLVERDLKNNIQKVSRLLEEDTND